MIMKRMKIIPLQIIILLVIFAGCTQKVSVTPPDAPPPDGYIYIDSNPPAAEIYINDKYVRRITPDSVTYLSTGSYKITLKKENFRDTSFAVQVTEGKRLKILVDYTKNPLMYGKIKCVSTPDNASIFLNGVATGKRTPVVLDNIFPGDYYVRYQLTNHLDDSVKVTVQSSSVVTTTKVLVDTTLWSFYYTSNSQIPSTSFTGLVVDPSNNIWIGTEDRGLLKFDGNIWKEYSVATSIIPDNNVKAIAVNQDGTVWAGTKFGLLLTGTAVMERIPPPGGGGPLVDVNIKDLFADGNDTTYIVTDTTFLKSYVSSGRVWELDTTDLHANLYISSKYSSICLTNSNFLWIGTEQSGLINVNTYHILSTFNSFQIGDNINTLAVSPSGVLWIGYDYTIISHSSVSYYANGNLTAPQIVPANSNTNTIFIDENDVKWIGTTKGLIEYNEATGRKLYDLETTGLNINDVRGIGEDSFGRLWIATYGEGVFVKKK